MSRPLRIEYPGAWYHVMNRGRRREDIYWSPKDYSLFLEVLQEASENWNIKVAAYCLMPNHYHLLVHTPDGNISRCMRHINGVYTQRFNRRHKTDGQLFRGRYKAVLVGRDNYLLEVLRYIHRNPLRAGLVSDLISYEWCSHGGYLSKSKKWSWLYKSELLVMLSIKKSQQKSSYTSFISKGEPEEIEDFYALKNLPSVLGSDTFKKWTKDTFVNLRNRPEVPDSRELAISSEQIIALVCGYFNVTKEQLCTSRRGKENLQRDLAIFLVRQYTRETLEVIGSYFGISRYSTVSSAVERIKMRSKNEQIVKEHLISITKRLNKSQKET